MNIFAVITVLLVTRFCFADTSYTVRRGDTLLKIADRALGKVNDPRRYDFVKSIRAKNPQLKNANDLNPGDSITLPEAPAAAGVVAKVVKAKAGRASSAPTVSIDEIANSQPTSEPQPEPAPTPAIVREAPPAPAPEATPEARVAVAPTPRPAEPEIAPVAAKPPSAPPHAAAHEAAHSETHDEGNADTLSFEPRYHFTKFKVKDKATEKDSEIITKENAGLDVTYAKAFGERTHGLLKVGFTYTDLGTFEPDTSTLDQNILWQKEFGLGASYELTHSLHLDGMIKAAEQTFLIPIAANTFVSKSVMIPGAELTLGWDFVRARTFSIGAQVSAEYFSRVDKDGITYDPTIDTAEAIYFNTERGEHRVNYRASLTYDASEHKTTVSEQESTSWIVGVGVIIPL